MPAQMTSDGLYIPSRFREPPRITPTGGSAVDATAGEPSQAQGDWGWGVGAEFEAVIDAEPS